MGPVKEVTTSEFASQVLESNLPVLVDFYADWCGPCRIIAPTLHGLAVEFAGQAKVVKVNVDEEPQLAAHFGVSGIPALMFFKDGELVDSIAGLAPVNVLRSKLERLLPARVSSRRVG